MPDGRPVWARVMFGSPHFIVVLNIATAADNVICRAYSEL
jgi:hypothetical protein